MILVRGERHLCVYLMLVCIKSRPRRIYIARVPHSTRFDPWCWEEKKS